MILKNLFLFTGKSLNYKNNIEVVYGFWANGEEQEITGLVCDFYELLLQVSPKVFQGHA